MNENYDVICFGEILWDIFPNKKVIGGAPLNVALRAHSYGLKVGIISRVGKDELASKIRDYFQLKNLDYYLTQEDSDWPTGYVSVTIDPKGTASYDINKPAAWDYIKLTEENIRAVEASKIFLYGSLACRNEISRKTLFRLIEKANIKVFDVNLRPPDYDYDEILKLMKLSDVVKLNDEELMELCNKFEIDSKDFNKAIADISNKTATKTVCVTKGDQGAVLLHQGEFYEHKGYNVKVDDTVGAGDSFLATLITELFIQDKSPDEAIKNACAIGAIVASKKGANPEIGISDIMTITENE
ncbi:fructokinase [Flavobacteriaceae bacterium MAR_2010_188]|nr:fructokinase [Flavobacteriaceae bacterium MAR_2010_188]